MDDYDRGYKDAWEGLDARYPDNHSYMSGYFDAEIDMEEAEDGGYDYEKTLELLLEY